MKNILPILLVVAVLIGIAAIGFNSNQVANPDFLRIHIRANSNDISDQNVKYKIKDAVVNYLAPLLADATTKEKAEAIVADNLKAIEYVANEVLLANGFTYTSKAKLLTEDFPTRVYENLTLESGIYDALILELGGAAGDNWWCVVYPPLCFVNASENSNGQVVYKSKLMEIIQSFFNY